MYNKVMKKGRYYEEKTAEIIQKHNPQAQIFQGIRIVGKLTTLKREVDVQLVDPSNYDNIVFECKDHKAKVDIELIEALVTKLKDLNTKKGAIVSNSGFTKGAHKAAEAHGIDLLSIVDSDDEKIRTKVFAPHIIEDTFVDRAGFSLNNMHGNFRLDPDINRTIIKTPTGDITWDKVLAKHWDEIHSKKRPIPGEYFLKINGGIIIDANENDIKVDEIQIRYFVNTRYYLRNVELIDTQGIYSVSAQTYRTNSLKSEVIRVKDFSDPKIWTPINENEAKNMIVPVRMLCATPMSVRLDL